MLHFNESTLCSKEETHDMILYPLISSHYIETRVNPKRTSILLLEFEFESRDQQSSLSFLHLSKHSSLAFKNYAFKLYFKSYLYYKKWYKVVLKHL